jgi:hypothetical protein
MIYEIMPIAEDHIDGFHKVLDTVARGRSIPIHADAAYQYLDLMRCVSFQWAIGFQNGVLGLSREVQTALLTFGRQECKHKT